MLLSATNCVESNYGRQSPTLGSASPEVITSGERSWRVTRVDELRYPTASHGLPTQHLSSLRLCLNSGSISSASAAEVLAAVVPRPLKMKKS